MKNLLRLPDVLSYIRVKVPSAVPPAKCTEEPRRECLRFVRPSRRKRIPTWSSIPGTVLHTDSIRNSHAHIDTPAS